MACFIACEVTIWSLSFERWEIVESSSSEFNSPAIDKLADRRVIPDMCVHVCIQYEGMKGRNITTLSFVTRTIHLLMKRDNAYKRRTKLLVVRSKWLELVWRATKLAELSNQIIDETQKNYEKQIYTNIQVSVVINNKAEAIFFSFFSLKDKIDSLEKNR